MAQLRRVLDGVLRHWGHDVFLQRRLPSGRFDKRFEKHTVRNQYPAVRGLPQTAEERREGLVHTVDMLYYFRRDANPKEGDRIWERDDRYPGPNGHGRTTWLIDYAVPMYGKRGLIDFWTVGVTRESPE